MSEKRKDGHLEPEGFVDLLDGSPVEASQRQHLEACAQCQAELGELESTLSLLTGIEVMDAPSPSPGSASLDETLSPKGEMSSRRWLVAAAVLVMGASVLYWVLDTPQSAPGPSVELEELLPPLHEDEEFKLLLALSDAFEEGWAPDELAPFDAEAALDLEELTPEQRQRFVEELADELRSSSL